MSRDLCDIVFKKVSCDQGAFFICDFVLRDDVMWQLVLHVVRIGHWQVRIRSTAVGMFELLSLSSTMIHAPITTEYSMNPLPLNKL